MVLDKREWATPVIVFLGVLLNGKSHTLSIPEDKRDKALRMVMWMMNQTKNTIKNIQKLTGTLNFLNRAIVPGQAFTRGMYQKLMLRGSNGALLKQYIT